MIIGSVNSATFIRDTSAEMKQLAEYTTAVNTLYSTDRKAMAEGYEKNAAAFEDNLKKPSCSIL